MTESRLFNDKELLTALSQGDEQAFRTLFLLHRDRIYSFSMHLTRSELLSEEITQEVFEKVWKHRQELAGIDHFISWIRVIARNVAFNYLRRMAHEKLILQGMQAPAGEADADNFILDREYNRLLQQAIGQLPEQQRKVYLLSRQDGLTYAQIADTLQISVNTVKTHLKEALRALRRFIEAHLTLALTIACSMYF